MSAQHSTISGADWARALPASRSRRAGMTLRVRESLLCPVCGKRGVHKPQKPKGLLVEHGGGVACWHPFGGAA